MPGTRFAEMLSLYENDPETKAVVVIGESGGSMEEEVAEIATILRQSNRNMAEQGEYSLDLYDAMMQYVQEYRTGSDSTAGN